MFGAFSIEMLWNSNQKFEKNDLLGGHMKIRQGFVSNSSTSSFCIYGTCLDSSEIIGKLKTEYKTALMLAQDSDDEDDLDVSDFLEQFFGEQDGSWTYYDPCEDGNYYIGRSWTDIKDEETARQFKDKIEQIIGKYFNAEGVNFGNYEEAFSD
jgi:hypothetical protein